MGAEIPGAGIAGIRYAKCGGLSPFLVLGAGELPVVDIRKVGLRLEIEGSVDWQLLRAQVQEQRGERQVGRRQCGAKRCMGADEHIGKPVDTGHRHF